MAAVIERITNVCCADFGKTHTQDEDEKPYKTSSKPQQSVATTPAPVVAAPVKQAPAPSASKFSGKATKYEELKWASLPEEAKKAASVLGFSESSWDNQEWIESEDKAWHDLTDEETAAAETLGWDATAWNTKYEDKSWSELPSVVQEAAAFVGFTQEMWDDDDWPEEVKHSGFEEIPADKQAALYVLGWTKNTWD